MGGKVGGRGERGRWEVEVGGRGGRWEGEVRGMREEVNISLHHRFFQSDQNFSVNQMG